MELKFTDTSIDNIISEGASQAYIEGAVPLPEGRGSAEVLSSGGIVALNSVSVRDGYIALEGKLRLDFLCSERGELFAFVSSAAFKHDIPVAEAKEGLSALVNAQLTTLDISGAGPFSIAATADISYVLVSSASTRLFDGISGASDLEKRESSYALRRMKDAGYQNIHLRDEIPFSSSDGAEKVISVSAAPISARSSREGDTLHIDGNLSVTALISTHGGTYKTLNTQLPYSAEASAAGLPADSECKISASVDYLELKPLGDVGDRLNVELSLTLRINAIEAYTLTCVLDAYSPSIPFECEYSELCVRSLVSRDFGECDISEALSPPEGMPDMAALVCCTARPVISTASVLDSTLTVDGVAFIKSAYLTENNSIYTFSRELPFSFTKPSQAPDGASVLAEAEVMSSEYALAGGKVSARFKLNMHADIYEKTVVRAVTGISEREKLEAPSGLYIYCADSGETLFDIGKRFNMSSDRIRAANPDVPDPCHDDTKLILLI